jgi:hypothetical protein
MRNGYRDSGSSAVGRNTGCCLTVGDHDDIADVVWHQVDGELDRGDEF